MAGVDPGAEAEAGIEPGSEVRDLKADATSLSHLMTHFPKNLHRIACQRAKMTAAPARKIYRPAPEAQAFGEMLRLTRSSSMSMMKRLGVSMPVSLSSIEAPDGLIATRSLISQRTKRCGPSETSLAQR